MTSVGLPGRYLCTTSSKYLYTRSPSHARLYVDEEIRVRNDSQVL